MYAKIATRAAARVGQSWRSTRSTLRAAKNDSATALSSQSLTAPADGTRPAACRCWRNAREVYCPPPIAVMGEARRRTSGLEGEAAGGEHQFGRQVVDHRPARHPAADL